MGKIIIDYDDACLLDTYTNRKLFYEYLYTLTYKEEFKGYKDLIQRDLLDAVIIHGKLVDKLKEKYLPDTAKTWHLRGKELIYE